jgi:spermidine synthase
LLSGFEVPLLLALGERMRLGSTNRVLGVDYFGALVGSVLFPVLLLRSFGLLATGFAVALANLMAALVLILWARVRRPVRYGLATAAISAGLVVALGHAYGIEQYFLKKFYYGEDVTGLSSLFHTQSTRPPIERHRSAYQTIDLAQDSLDSQWVYDEISAKRTAEPRYPRNLWLYLDREYQVHSGTDEVYHEWFVHAPVQANGHAPHHVLVLGGGDGLAVREALKYPTVTRVVHVDIDPVMLRLAREHPLLSAMNGGVHDDPRVTIVEADAVQWLRTTVARFDAIYIDMPAPRDYSLSQVYSREFYGLVRHHLDTGGFVAIDTPSGWCENPDNLWAIYYSTLRAAGFETVVPMIARINTGAPRVLDAIDRLIAETEVTVPAPGGGTIALNEAQAHEYYDGALDELLSQGADEFVLAFPSRRTVNTTWRTDLAVPRYMFGPPHLPLAFPDGCASEFQLTKVNSIARPTLPELEWLSIRFP